VPRRGVYLPGWRIDLEHLGAGRLERFHEMACIGRVAQLDAHVAGPAVRCPRTRRYGVDRAARENLSRRADARAGQNLPPPLPHRIERYGRPRIPEARDTVGEEEEMGQIRHRMVMHVPEARHQILATRRYDVRLRWQLDRCEGAHRLDTVAHDDHALVWDELPLRYVDYGHPVEHQRCSGAGSLAGRGRRQASQQQRRDTGRG